MSQAAFCIKGWMPLQWAIAYQFYKDTHGNLQLPTTRYSCTLIANHWWANINQEPPKLLTEHQYELAFNVAQAENWSWVAEMFSLFYNIELVDIRL